MIKHPYEASYITLDDVTLPDDISNWSSFSDEQKNYLIDMKHGNCMLFVTKDVVKCARNVRRRHIALYTDLAINLIFREGKKVATFYKKNNRIFSIRTTAKTPHRVEVLCHHKFNKFLTPGTYVRLDRNTGEVIEILNAKPSDFVDKGF